MATEEKSRAASDGRSERVPACGWALVGDFDGAVLAALPERDRARARREDRVVPTEPGARAGAELRPALPDDDHSRLDLLAGKDLHAQHLRLGVATVSRRSESLLVRHYSASSFGFGSAFALGFAAAFGFAAVTGFSAFGAAGAFS